MKMKLNKIEKTGLIAALVVFATGAAALVWWLTKRRADRCLIGVRGEENNGNIITAAVQTVIDKGKEILGMKYFTISELTRSATANRLGIDNTPNAAVRANLEALVVNCLDPIRTIYGKPIIVSSGYRCEALNRAVGGVANSQHKAGNAADIKPASGGSLNDIFRAAVRYGDFDQLILENVGSSRWIHISWVATGRRHRILYYKNGTYTNITGNWENYL